MSPTESAIPNGWDGQRGEAGHIGYLLRQANGAFRVRLERALADLGITQPQFAVLTMIAADPGISGADLARTSLLTPPTVSVIVANLRRAGLVEDAPHPTHGRIRRLDLTISGQTTLELCKARVGALERRLTEGLSPAEQATVRRWLTHIAIGSPGEE
ncbi:MAG: MarR family winged helix-turn-helix transcriptional regulator [Roseiarcus sp.]